jgi:hypothetical protein
MKRERPADEIRRWQLNYAECPHREIALRLNGSYMAIKGYLRNCARDRQKRQYDVLISPTPDHRPRTLDGSLSSTPL